MCPGCSGTIRCIPPSTELLSSSQKVFEVCDKGLVVMATMMDGNEHIRSIARAEQTRRQTNAINQFTLSPEFPQRSYPISSITFMSFG